MSATATEVKNRFGEFMDKAQREPILIEKSGRNYAVLMSYEEFQRLVAADDAVWVAKAIEAEKSGYIGSDLVAELLTDLQCS